LLPDFTEYTPKITQRTSAHIKKSQWFKERSKWLLCTDKS